MVRFRTEDIAEATHQHIEFGDAGQARCKAAVDDRLLRVGKNNIWPLPPDQPHIRPQGAQVIERVGSRPSHWRPAIANPHPAQHCLNLLIGVGGAGDHVMPSSRHRRPKASTEIDERERSEEHTSELQSLMRISYAVFCLKKKTTKAIINKYQQAKYNPLY